MREDLGQAVYWFRRAANQGLEAAIEALDEHKPRAVPLP